MQAGLHFDMYSTAQRTASRSILQSEMRDASLSEGCAERVSAEQPGLCANEYAMVKKRDEVGTET